MKQLEAELIIDEDIGTTIISLRLGSYVLDQLRVKKERQYAKQSAYLVIKSERIEMEIEEADLVYYVDQIHEPRKIINSDNEALQSVSYANITLFKGTYTNMRRIA